MPVTISNKHLHWLSFSLVSLMICSLGRSRCQSSFSLKVHTSRPKFSRTLWSSSAFASFSSLYERKKSCLNSFSSKPVSFIQSPKAPCQIGVQYLLKVYNSARVYHKINSLSIENLETRKSSADLNTIRKFRHNSFYWQVY